MMIVVQTSGPGIEQVIRERDEDGNENVWRVEVVEGR